MKKFSITWIIFLFTFSAKAQLPLVSQFLQLKFPEKLWALKHLQKAKIIYYISLEARKTTDSLAKVYFLDGDTDGGQLDAFRHGFWMAMLTRYMSPEDCKTLGIALEKSNNIDFKRRQKDERSLPDKAASDMDLWNNEIGIKIGLRFPDIPMDSLHKIICRYIINGEMKVVKKNSNGASIDQNNRLIPIKSLQHTWDTPRLLVPSNFVRPNGL